MPTIMIVKIEITTLLPVLKQDFVKTFRRKIMKKKRSKSNRHQREVDIIMILVQNRTTVKLNHLIPRVAHFANKMNRNNRTVQNAS
jgi:hypothetical protein